VKDEAAAREQIATGLKKLNLSTYEATVYGTLLVHPAMTAGALCKETGISDTKIYYALDGLAEKGMVNIRNSSPKVYKPVPPKEAIANLKQRLKEKLNEELKAADDLFGLLVPIYENAEKPFEELEIGYIINGRNNIANRMKALISNARKEITLFVSYPELFKELSSSLREAEAVKKYVPQLRKQADVVVVLSHCGDNYDKEIAKKVNGIDLILSAHLHKLFKQQLYILVPVLPAYKYHIICFDYYEVFYSQSRYEPFIPIQEAVVGVHGAVSSLYRVSIFILLHISFKCAPVAYIIPRKAAFHNIYIPCLL
jgi:sugar-specific transcriptional regulator TrmB